MNAPEQTSNGGHEIGPVNIERLTRSARRFEPSIGAGIEAARAQGREIDDDTAALIEHVLTRADGRRPGISADTAGGDEHDPSDDFMRIYAHPATPPVVRDWIVWLDSYQRSRKATPAKSTELGELPRPPYRPRLVACDLTIADEVVVVYLPPSMTGPAIRDVVARLEALPQISDPAFRAFLSLPDVEGAATNLPESFAEFYIGDYADVEALLYALSPLQDWETELRQWAAENGLPADSVQIDRTVVLQQTREVYDIVEKDGGIYAFNK